MKVYRYRNQCICLNLKSVGNFFSTSLILNDSQNSSDVSELSEMLAIDLERRSKTNNVISFGS